MTNSTKRILLARFLDQGNLNAQILNSRALLANWQLDRFHVRGWRYGDIEPEFTSKAGLKVEKSLPWRFFQITTILGMLTQKHIIFYPDYFAWYSRTGLEWVDRLGVRPLIVNTIEGLAVTKTETDLLAKSFGHPVFPMPNRSKVEIDNFRYHMQRADHLVAISPFLKKAGDILYNRSCQLLPLGVDQKIFYPQQAENSGRERFTVLSVGSLKGGNKNTHLFFDLAGRYPQARFRWLGDGPERIPAQQKAAKMVLDNLHFPGAMSPPQVAEEMRQANLFALPSKSEGAPKVLQEAQSCGLPLIAFGYYEPPSIQADRNGLLAMSEEEWLEHVGSLINNPGRAREMGAESVLMSQGAGWQDVAPLWEDFIAGLLE